MRKFSCRHTRYVLFCLFLSFSACAEVVKVVIVLRKSGQSKDSLNPVGITVLRPCVVEKKAGEHMRLREQSKASVR